MRVNITARHHKPSDRLKEHVTLEVQKLDKFYEGIISCEVILDSQKLEQIAEIIIHVQGNRLTSVEKSEDIYKSIDLAVTKIERQLKKYKGKMQQFNVEKIQENTRAAM
jgi:putative sigma-54 modulation protein